MSFQLKFYLFLYWIVHLFYCQHLANCSLGLFTYFVVKKYNFSFLFLKFVSLIIRTWQKLDRKLKLDCWPRHGKCYTRLIKATCHVYVICSLQLYIDKIIDLVFVMSKFTYDLCTALCTITEPVYCCLQLESAWLGPFWWLDWWIRETKKKNYTF
jgi:hypothetical protein